MEQPTGVVHGICSVCALYKCWVRLFWKSLSLLSEMEHLCVEKKTFLLPWSLDSDGALSKILVNHSVKGNKNKRY